MLIYFALFIQGIVSLPSLKEVPVLLIIGFTLVWLFWGEFRTKMIKVTIDTNNISVRKFGGLGKERDFPLSDFDGFKVQKQAYGARGVLE